MLGIVTSSRLWQPDREAALGEHPLRLTSAEGFR